MEPCDYFSLDLTATDSDGIPLSCDSHKNLSYKAYSGTVENLTVGKKSSESPHLAYQFLGSSLLVSLYMCMCMCNLKVLMINL